VVTPVLLWDACWRDYGINGDLSHACGRWSRVDGYWADGWVGAQVREARRGAGLTQLQLAARARVSIGFIRDLEQGRFSHPRRDLVGRVADALGLNATEPVGDLHNGTADMGRVATSVAGHRRGRGESTRFRVSVLGPLLVQGGSGQPVTGAPAALLGLLALHPNVTVSRHSIVDVLWGDTPPRSAIGMVHSYVSRLRSALETGHDGLSLVVRDHGGYRLDLEVDQLDLLIFRQLVDAARRAWAAGDPEMAYVQYERALGLWRDAPLADIELLQQNPAVAGVADEVAAAVREFADVAGATPGADQERVLEYLRILTARDELDELSHARLMVTLAAGGRQAEALRVYEGLRQRLDEQMGVLPGEEVRAAHTAILRQELLEPASSTRPVPANDSWHPVFQLPAALADFTGRAAERQRIVRALTEGGLQPGVPVVAVCGPPGIGKTALALHAAHCVREQFPDGQVWLDLAGSSARPRSIGEVLGELLRGLGMDGSAVPDDDSGRAACWRSKLAGRRVLMVVDDAATAAQIRPVMPGTAGSALVVTSRAQLESLDGAHLVSLEVMTVDEALGLLTRIIGQPRVQAEPGAARRLAQACGTLPLALRIAGAKLASRPSWPVSAMVRAITSTHGRLAELQAGELSVRASIASSYESLPELPRRAFRLLSVLGPSDFAAWVTGALIGEPPVDVTGELSGRSLLNPLSIDATGEPRFRLHDLLRDYAAERLQDEPVPATKAALERLLGGWLQLAKLADSRLPQEPYFPPSACQAPVGVVPERIAARLTADPIAWFTTERINLLAAATQAGQIGRADLALELATHQCAFHHLQDRYDDAEQLWREVASQAAQADSAKRTYIELRIGASMLERGHAADAFPVLDACVKAAEQGQDPETLSFALYWRSSCAAHLGDFKSAQADADRGVRTARRADSRLAELANLRCLNVSLIRVGQADQAITAGETALAIATDLGIGAYTLAALHNVAYTCTLTGQYARAVELCHQRIRLSQELGDIRGQALSLGVLADAYYGQGQYDLAVQSLHQAMQSFAAHGADRNHALCLMKLGLAYEAMGSHQQAIRHLQDSLPVFHQLRLPHKVKQVEDVLARCRSAVADQTQDHEPLGD
jgi:DNA-binding SARP family transcriptional activator/tetratricopeptide (TPR) repeat protein/transcriptional regulator with XRE-family HTH domain